MSTWPERSPMALDPTRRLTSATPSGKDIATREPNAITQHDDGEQHADQLALRLGGRCPLRRATRCTPPARRRPRRPATARSASSSGASSTSLMSKVSVVNAVRAVRAHHGRLRVERVRGAEDVRERRQLWTVSLTVARVAGSLRPVGGEDDLARVRVLAGELLTQQVGGPAVTPRRAAGRCRSASPPTFVSSRKTEAATTSHAATTRQGWRLARWPSLKRRVDIGRPF